MINISGSDLGVERAVVGWMGGVLCGGLGGGKGDQDAEPENELEWPKPVLDHGARILAALDAEDQHAAQGEENGVCERDAQDVDLLLAVRIPGAVGVEVLAGKMLCELVGHVIAKYPRNDVREEKESRIGQPCAD